MAQGHKKSARPDQNEGNVEPNIIRGAYTNNVEEVASALAASPEAIGQLDPETGGTALHVAIYRGNVDIVRFILEHANPDLSARDRLGRDAVHIAVESGHPVIGTMILSRAAGDAGLGPDQLPPSP